MKPVLKYPYFLSEATRNLDIASDEFYVQALDEINEEASICALELEDFVLEFIAYHS